MPGLREDYLDLKSVVMENFPSLWPLTHAYLAATASICWSDFPLPVTMIAMGPSGSGKTEPMGWIMRSGLDQFLRVDAFTPASFVTHSPNVKRTDLGKMDLLPRMKNRCLCTKELAPLFAGREDELRVRFAQLTSVLDGEGLVTASGTQGTRGYGEPIVFSWLGATTPPSKKIFALMAALGTRLFFFSTDFERPTSLDYSAIIRGTGLQQSVKRAACQSATAEFVARLFKSVPVRSLEFARITITDAVGDTIGLYCSALSRLRGAVNLFEGNGDESERYGTPSVEHGWRAAQVLAALAKGSALIRGETEVGPDDLEFVRRVFLSSMPEYRRKTFASVLFLGGRATAAQVADHSNMARKTAIRHLKELRILEIVEGDLEVEPFDFRLLDEFEGLLDKHTPSKSVTPLSERDHKNGNTISARNHSAECVTPNDGVQSPEDEEEAPVNVI